jgi:hypothetical protein
MAMPFPVAHLLSYLGHYRTSIVDLQTGHSIGNPRKGARERLRKLNGDANYKSVEPWLDAYAVVGMDGCVKTVGHHCKRLRRT